MCIENIFSSLLINFIERRKTMFTAKEIKSRKKLVAVAITIIVIFASSLLLYNYIIDSVKLTKEDAITRARLERYDYIWGYLNTLVDTAAQHTTVVSASIESDIKEQFDMDELYYALESNDSEVQHQLEQIFINNIENEYYGGLDNHRNSMMVLTGRGDIVEDYTLDRTMINDPSIYANHSFSRYETIALNEALVKDAYNKIKSHSTEIIAVEIYDLLNNPDHILVPEISYMSLKDVYLKEGIMGFKNYQFLIPAYITDTGDIFGQQDIVAGEPQDTYKYIVIQSVSLYDQLLSIDAGAEDADYLKPIEAHYNNIIDQLHLLGIVICVAVALCILYMMSLYNVIVDERNREESVLEDNNI